MYSQIIYFRLEISNIIFYNYRIKQRSHYLKKKKKRRNSCKRVRVGEKVADKQTNRSNPKRKKI